MTGGAQAAYSMEVQPLRRGAGQRAAQIVAKSKVAGGRGRVIAVQRSRAFAPANNCVPLAKNEWHANSEEFHRLACLLFPVGFLGQRDSHARRRPARPFVQRCEYEPNDGLPLLIGVQNDYSEGRLIFPHPTGNAGGNTLCLP